MKAARALLLAFVLFVFLFFFRSTVLAQSPSASSGQAPVSNTEDTNTVNPYVAPNTNPDVPKNMHTYTQSVMLELAASLACQLGGIDPTNPSVKCLGVDHTTGKIGYVENGGGVAGILTYMIAATYVNPVRTSDYVNYLANNFGFEKKAYADSHDEQIVCNSDFGLGYCGIFPLINIWTTMRNMIYLLFVVIFMAIGLGIMLRVHIDPRTVMAVENQIPKIIIAIILATFSFAIAGFMVDIMYTVIFLVYSVFNSIPGVDDLVAVGPKVLQNTSAIGIGNELTSDGLHGLVFNLAGSLGETFRKLFDIRPFNPLDVIPFGNEITSLFKINPFTVRNDVGSPMDWIIDVISISSAFGFGSMAAQGAEAGANVGPLGAGVNFRLPTFLTVFGAAHAIFQASLRNLLPFIIPYLVLLFAVVIALFRVWFALIQAYILFLVDVVTAPFWMLAGLIPGSKLSFTGWFRDVAANLSAFVVVIVTLWLGKLFINAFGCDPNSTGEACKTAAQGFFVPPLIGADLTTNLIGSIIGIGTLLSLPDALRLTRAAFKPPEIDLKAAGKALAGGGSVAKGTVTGSAASVFVASQGTLKPDEKGLGAVLRRILPR